MQTTAHTAPPTPIYRRCRLSDAFTSGKTKPSKLTTQTRISVRRANLMSQTMTVPLARGPSRVPLANQPVTRGILGIVHDVDVVSGRLYIRVTAKRARKYIQNDFPSARPCLADYLTQTFGNIVSNAADRLALPVDRTRNRFKVISKLNEVGEVDDNGIAMHAVDAVTISSIKHFPAHSLMRQAAHNRTCTSDICSTTRARRGKTAGCSGHQPSRRIR